MQAWFEVRRYDEASMVGIAVSSIKVDGDQMAKLLADEFENQGQVVYVRFLFIGSHLTYDHANEKSAARNVVANGWIK